MTSTKSFNIHSPSVRRSLVLVIVVVSLSLLFLSSSHLGHYITKETLFFSSSQYGAEKLPYRSNIAKVSIAFDGSESPTIQRAFETHFKHNAMHGYHHFIDRQRLVDEVFNPNPPWGAWSKPAYVLNILLTELAKPPEERFEWLFWFDADSIIANPTTPLEVFLPPNTKELESIHFIITSNMDGINDGVFAIRVHRWSVELMSAVVAYPTYFPQNVTASRFGEQSALEWLLKSPDSPIQEVNSHWADAPARWFNALPFNNPVVPKENNIGILASEMTPERFDAGTTDVYQDGSDPMIINPWKVMRGDLVVHFAGSTWVRDSWMKPWLDRVEANTPEWADVGAKQRLEVEAAAFWEKKGDELRST